MKELTTKQLKRLDRKTAKMAAFLEIASLNDKDKEAKLQASKQTTIITDRLNSPSKSDMAEECSNRKRSSDNDLGNTCLEACEEKKDPDELQSENNNKKPRLSGAAYVKLKEELRKRKKILQAIPRLTLKTVGENATLNIENIKNRIPIFLSDIQHLLLYALLGLHSPYQPTRWCKLEKYNKLSHTVVFVVEGLSSYHFMAYENMFPHIVDNFKDRLEVVTPAVYGGSIIEELVAVPLTGTQSDRLIKKYGSLETALQIDRNVIKLVRSAFPVHLTNSDMELSTKKNSDENATEKNSDENAIEKNSDENAIKKNSNENATEKNSDENLPFTDKFSRTKLLLSIWQMMEENYPLPLKGTLAERYNTYILTKDLYEPVTATSPMFGLDCEMCLTTSGNMELTRISVVDESMNIIYDTLVKPKNAITNYLTRFSGITEEMLENVTVTLHDVQQALRSLLPADAILIGQSLNSDLHALKMMHPYNIDTSVIFNLSGDRNRKTKLQTLAREFLGEIIQDSKAGHCSAEDSIASIKLVKLKLANSVAYGDAVLLGDCDMRTLRMETDKASWWALRKAESKKYAKSIFSHITKIKDTTAAIVGSNETMSEYSKYLQKSSLNDENFTNKIRLVKASNDKEAIKRTSEIAMEHAFVLCHIKIKEEQLKDEQIEKTFRTVNKWIRKLWKCSATNSFTCVIFGGQKNAVNGTCFLNIKTELPPGIRQSHTSLVNT